jgi:hypothetical protein
MLTDSKITVSPSLHKMIRFTFVPANEGPCACFNHSKKYLSAADHTAKQTVLLTVRFCGRLPVSAEVPSIRESVQVQDWLPVTSKYKVQHLCIIYSNLQSLERCIFVTASASIIRKS